MPVDGLFVERQRSFRQDIYEEGNKRMIRRVLYLTIIAILLAMIIEARQMTFAASAASAADAEVKIDNFSFTPATLTVPAGTSVTWTNHDDIPHNVVSEDKSIKSKVLDTDEKFTFTFSKPGTYSYFCSIHPKMKGTVVVQ
jgi:plastocyanin